MAGSTKVGRAGSTGTFTNTIAPKSAEQAMLLKLDELIDTLKAVAAQLDTEGGLAGSSTYTNLVSALEKCKLVR